MAGDQAKSGRAWMSEMLHAMKGKAMRSRNAGDHSFADSSPISDIVTASFGSMLSGLKDTTVQESPLSDAVLYLRHPTKRDFLQWAQLRAASADFLRPWEPIWPQDDLTPQGFRRRLEQYQKDRRSGRSLPYLIFRSDNNQLLGGINVSNIRRGICQTASIGYWMGEDHAGHGYMSHALALLLPYLFDFQKLHRVEAACLPSNQPSISVLQRQGFQLEGKARSYLCINGQWEDHLLFSVLRSDLVVLKGDTAR